MSTEENATTNTEENSPLNTENDVEQIDQVHLGRRATKFNHVTKKWINRCVQTISLNKLHSELDPIIPDLSDEIREAHAQGQEYMAEELTEILADKVKETQLIEKMNRMDELIEEAKKREKIEKRVAPTPEQYMRQSVCSEKEKEAQALRTELASIRKENDLLMQELSNLKNSLSNKRVDITQDIEKFKNATAIVNSIPAEDLIATMKEMDISN